MIAGTLIDGHILLSDWLLLIGAVLFVLAAVLSLVVATTERPRPAWLGHGFLIAAGLALVAVGWLVL